MHIAFSDFKLICGAAPVISDTDSRIQTQFSFPHFHVSHFHIFSVPNCTNYTYNTLLCWWSFWSSTDGVRFFCKFKTYVLQFRCSLVLHFQVVNFCAPL